MQNYINYIKKLSSENKLQIITKNINKEEFIGLRNFIYERTSYTDGDASIRERCYQIVNDMHTIPICESCGNRTVYRKNNYVCIDKECLSKRRESNRRKTLIEKYGTDNVRAVPGVNDKIEQTTLERYGETNVLKNKKIREKRAATILNDSTFYERRNEKTKQTCQEKYGTEYASQNDDVKEKIQKTMNTRFGMHHSKLQSFKKRISKVNKTNAHSAKKKREKTMLKKYGHRSALQVPHILKKQQKSARKYAMHECGLLYQGTYEKDFLDNYSRTVKIEKFHYMQYALNGNMFKYLPDFYIPKLNLIIEIKSSWTFELHKEKNLAKEKMCKENGYNFMFIVDKEYEQLDDFLKERF